MTGHIGKFVDVVTISPPISIFVASREQLLATARGSTRLVLNGKTVRILKDVLFAEGLAKNLISLAKAAISRLTAVVANDKCVISNANSQLVATRDHRNLYVAEATSVEALKVESAASVDAFGHDCNGAPEQHTGQPMWSYYNRQQREWCLATSVNSAEEG